MASTFNVELSMREAPSEAQARAATALTEPARAVGLRLTKRGAGELGYKPRVQFPFLVMLYHNLSGEQMSVKFEPGSEGGRGSRSAGRSRAATTRSRQTPSTGQKRSAPRFRTSQPELSNPRQAGAWDRVRASSRSRPAALKRSSDPTKTPMSSAWSSRVIGVTAMGPPKRSVVQRAGCRAARCKAVCGHASEYRDRLVVVLRAPDGEAMRRGGAGRTDCALRGRGSCAGRRRQRGVA